jgi:hypothetical protein
VTQLLQSLLLIVLSCGFAGTSTAYAFDFYYAPSRDIQRLRHLALTFLGTTLGLTASIALFVLNNRP